MSTQQERSRLDEDNIEDKNTDVTRSENQQRNAANDASAGKEGYGSERGTHQSETGSHQEGTYDKQNDKPMLDRDGISDRDND